MLKGSAGIYPDQQTSLRRPYIQQNVDMPSNHRRKNYRKFQKSAGRQNCFRPSKTDPPNSLMARSINNPA